MNGIYADSYYVYAQISGVWTDITSDICSEIKGSYGFTTNNPVDLVANTGTLRFSLKNYDGKYSAGLSTALTGWKSNIPIKLEITYENVTNIKFIGTIESINIKSEQFGNSIVEVLCVDWLDIANQCPLINLSAESDKTANQGITTLLTYAPIQPTQTNLSTGANTFEIIFDSTQKKSTIYSELSKITLSECGRLYIRNDDSIGGKLVFESSKTRNGTKTLDQIPVSKDDSDFLLKEDGDHLLLESGDHIYINEIKDMSMEMMDNLVVKYGENIINRFDVTANPRTYSGSTLLYELVEAVSVAFPPISSGDLYYFNCYFYVDGQFVNATNLQTPNLGVDIILNTSGSDYTGVNTSSDSNVVFSGDGASTEVNIINTSASPTYIKEIRIYGDIISTGGQLSVQIEDPDSITENGYKKQSLDQNYQTTLTAGTNFVEYIVEEYREAESLVTQISFTANADPDLFSSFLKLDIGSLINVKESNMDIDENYFIQSVEYQIIQGGIIKVTYKLIRFLSLLNGLSRVELEFPNATYSFLDFGVVPDVLQLNTHISYEAWVYPTLNFVAGDTARFIMGYHRSDDIETSLWITKYGNLRFQTITDPTLWTSLGQWETTGSPVASINNWYHVVVTREQNSPANDPIIYVNGTSVAINENSHPGFRISDESNSIFTIGGTGNSVPSYTKPFVGKIKNVRVYNKILSQSEVTTLYTSGSVTDSLVFDGLTVKTKDLASLDGTGLTDHNKIIDNMYHAIGTPYYAVGGSQIILHSI